MKCVAIALSSFTLLLVLFEGAISFPVKERYAAHLKENVIEMSEEEMSDRLELTRRESSCPAGYGGTGCDEALPCVASTSRSDDTGSDGNFYCINGGTVGGYTGSCTCTDCDTGFGAPFCGSSCVASTNTMHDGWDENFYCINGGTVGGYVGSCACTDCDTGFGGASCNEDLSCVASTSPSDDGSDGNFYCINGGTVSGLPGSCTCTSCNTGYGGLHCGPPCMASTSPSDDGLSAVGFLTSYYCINGGTVGGYTGSCTCTDCDAGMSGPHCELTSSPTPSPTASPRFYSPSNMTELYHLVSSNGGNSIIIPTGRDTVELAVGQYKCSEGTCQPGSRMMLFLDNLNGGIECVNDDASCVLDGENTRRIMDVKSTSYKLLTISAITFKNGRTFYGGGMYIYGANVIVDLKFCVFTNCEATYLTDLGEYNGGGAIYIEHNYVILNVYGTTFTNNKAVSGIGDDIFRAAYILQGNRTYPKVHIHATCPSPYSSLSPIQGSSLDIYDYGYDPEYDYGKWRNSSFGSPYSFVGCAPTQSPTPSPTTSPTSLTAAPTESYSSDGESLNGSGAVFKATVNAFVCLVCAAAGAAAANAFA